jgi:tetratricopeptide (TPR) repeat protein
MRHRALLLAFPFAFYLFTFAFPVVPNAQTRTERRPTVSFDWLREWLAAVNGHEPGLRDASAIAVGSWSRRELEALYPDVRALVELMTRSGKVPSRRAVGLFSPEVLKELQQIADEERLRGPNSLLKRGAVLHTDIALLIAPSDGESRGLPPVTAGAVLAPRTPSIMVADGRQTGVQYGAVHWDFARVLLDGVTPDPSHDDVVRRWYRATAVYFLSQRQFADAVPHLERARRLFPADPGILMESGYLHEVLAAPRVQDVVRGTLPPAGLVFAVAPQRSNLRDAETDFRRAVEADEAFIEARLRLGHVVGLLGRHAEAVSHLQQALAGATDRLLQYHASMFLGNEQQALGQRDRARESYEKAAALYPRAQSPRLALTQLARGAGDRPGAWRALQPLLTLPADQSAREDPWWGYYEGQGRNAAPLFSEVRALVSLGEPR